VRLIEPFGFTKISALGVEEQRVNVVIDLAEPRGLASDGARLSRPGRDRHLVDSIDREGSDQRPVPHGQSWSLFLAEDGHRARLVPVEVGRMNDEEAEIKSGSALAIGSFFIPATRSAMA
jgi:HlyD family secretion protein